MGRGREGGKSTGKWQSGLCGWVYDYIRSGRAGWGAVCARMGKADLAGLGGVGVGVPVRRAQLLLGAKMREQVKCSAKPQNESQPAPRTRQQRKYVCARVRVCRSTLVRGCDDGLLRARALVCSRVRARVRVRAYMCAREFA
eukprot:2337923-Pleurochrysis_carterae.AAC.1